MEMEPSTWGRVKLRQSDENETQTVGWDQLVATGVVERSLLASVHATDREAIRLVEEGGWLVVLAFAVLDDEAVTWPVGVHWQSDLAACLASITEQPVETVTARTAFAEHLVAQVQHVVLVAGLPAHGRSIWRCVCAVEDRWIRSIDARSLVKPRTESGRPVEIVGQFRLSKQTWAARA
ncbi:hypothetical protein C1I92_02400 [Jiangella anatolica]|uniref:Uncharacterized protein n=1 Tax=Jiangella anatolica TaxID=2670374 RepID=A0A2W2CKY3_9ACTN|nr:hypothetical protein C1I92_02400 [Jiangella anatolica]